MPIGRSASSVVSNAAPTRLRGFVFEDIRLPLVASHEKISSSASETTPLLTFVRNGDGTLVRLPSTLKADDALRVNPSRVYAYALMSWNKLHGVAWTLHGACLRAEPAPLGQPCITVLPIAYTSIERANCPTDRGRDHVAPIKTNPSKDSITSCRVVYPNLGSARLLVALPVGQLYSIGIGQSYVDLTILQRSN